MNVYARCRKLLSISIQGAENCYQCVCKVLETWLNHFKMMTLRIATLSREKRSTYHLIFFRHFPFGLYYSYSPIGIDHVSVID